MSEILIYILISSSYDGGSATVIDRFATEVECIAIKEMIPELRMRGLFWTQKTNNPLYQS